MTKQELAKLLVKIQLVDNRKIDQMVLAEWFDIVGHLDFVDAVEAVRVHRQTSTEYLQPAHIVQGSRVAQRDRSLAATRAHLLELEEARVRAVPMPASLRKQMLGGSDV